jgi:hypothetical protein
MPMSELGVRGKFPPRDTRWRWLSGSFDYALSLASQQHESLISFTYSPPSSNFICLYENLCVFCVFRHVFFSKHSRGVIPCIRRFIPISLSPRLNVVFLPHFPFCNSIFRFTTFIPLSSVILHVQEGNVISYDTVH